mmetsp:Transcript_16037/g.46047  ORF Transcript_16037/g.46047 Transcript_16037/m.46047 type:complete len:225 (+) Transcript_16037:1789-2463(+)
MSPSSSCVSGLSPSSPSVSSLSSGPTCSMRASIFTSNSMVCVASAVATLPNDILLVRGTKLLEYRELGPRPEAVVADPDAGDLPPAFSSSVRRSASNSCVRSSSSATASSSSSSDDRPDGACPTFVSKRSFLDWKDWVAELSPSSSDGELEGRGREFMDARLCASVISTESVGDVTGVSFPPPRFWASKALTSPASSTVFSSLFPPPPEAIEESAGERATANSA